VNDGAYALLIIAMFLVLWRSGKTVLSSFKNPRTWLGIPLGLGVIFLSAVWSSIATQLGATTNQNESAVETTILYLPVLSVLMTGFVAPFCEELTYRVGAFGFLKRFNRFIAYLVVGILFGLIHLHDFTSANEWLAFPSYAIAGFSFCFIYEYFGFGASFLAHATNNVVAVISVIIAYLYAQ
jgi:membrane protease YdiL (CAAX protease family)